MTDELNGSLFFPAERDVTSGQPNTLMKGDVPPQPVWFPKKGRHGGTLEVVYSQKMKTRVYLSYPLEYMHWALLELDPEVLMFCRHPLSDDVSVAGKKVSTTFDMWVRFRTLREELREIKPMEEIKNGTSRKQILAQKALAQLKGIDYRVVTDEDIEQQPRLRNCLRMFPYLSQYPGEEWERQVLRLVDGQGVVPLTGLGGATFHDAQCLIHAAIHLIARGDLYTPLAELEWNKLTLERTTDEQTRQPFI